ncbi:hypothetical protein PLESTB_000877700 [Pleodorina starrii]|uniref:DNA-directed RNA polymerase subunit beta n=1 Tax=Pleodorina starrii TaxID=330485 RepID=A0A9W6F3P5_9CHLO|nr:hypothetical protein PLESTB_000877700 [Pleodorina starrii]
MTAIPIGHVPVMVRSKYCVLRDPSFMTANECMHDYGGYCIVNGNEKVIISQDRITANKPFVFLSTKGAVYSHVAEVRSMADDHFGVPKITTIKLSAKPNQHGRYIKANIHHIKHDIPLFVLFRALGLESDRVIIEAILGGEAIDPANSKLVEALIGSADDASGLVDCQREALEYLARYLNMNGHPREFMADRQYRMDVLRGMLERDLLPHVGPSLEKKALYLAIMVKKLLCCFLGQEPLDDRDSYVNKRVDTPGILLGNLFRQYYGKLVKDMRNMLQKEVASGSWRASNRLLNVVSKVNVNKVIKSTIIWLGLKYALATGNWGVKSKKTKQGVAQLLNRMTYTATLSHLRRISTPIEKSGKIIQPRKLHATQWGVVCPCETPEGAAVGLVKNLALMAGITNTTSSVPGREVSMRTEGGRCVRPLFVVGEGNKLLADDDMAHRVHQRTMRWADIILSGVVEYLDVEECNRAMIAMRPADLTTGQRYTHMEMHPSLILGVLAGSIPFSDHNQAPRNTYQCLWEHEPVLMADGTTLAIRDVRPGDRVVTFDPSTLEPSYTQVVHQYVRPTEKQLFRVTTVSGRSIVATEDHKFMTDQGWMEWSQDGFSVPAELSCVNTWQGSTVAAAALLTLRRVWYDGERISAAATALERLHGDSGDMVGPHGHLGYSALASVEPVPNAMIADITTASCNHSFIAGGGFAVHNSAMGKQAIGIYTTNYRERYDTVGHVLNYPQRPIVQTRTARIVNTNEMPCGVNAIVAIATFTGYNQEDSIILNKSAVERGLFQSTVYKTVRDQNNKNHSTGEEEFYCRPDTDSVRQIKPYNYSKLDETGFVPENTLVEGADIIIGKCMPQKVDTAIVHKDTSVALKGSDRCYIDRNACCNRHFINVNGDGYTFCKIRTRAERVPTVGDKFSSRHGQKGTCGMVYPQEDLPFSKDGLVPDIIVNPHAIPSRMTIAQLMECIMGKACTMLGTFGDGTPFTDVTVEDLAKALESVGMERYGNEILYNSRTGEQIDTPIFIGPTYYQRLKHMVCDKVHSRASNGPVVMLTRQPAEGRARDGGLRLGEMEVECNWAHGSMQFLKERIMECSDNYRIFLCRLCGMMATAANPEKNIWSCKGCNNTTQFAEVRIPYAAKLMFQEVQAMGIAARFRT